MNNLKLIVISAPSGTGKTSVIKEILKIYKDKIIFSISATTRPKRPDETHGVDYYFISKEEFEQKIKNNEFIEWEKIYDYYYGTPKSEIERAKKLNKHLLFELDVKGSLSLKKLFKEAITIFMIPPSLEVLEKRLKKRNTETPEDFIKRMERAKMEIEMAKLFDYQVLNDKLERAVDDVNNIIQKIIEN